MSKRALTVGFLTAGLSVGVVASVISPAAAQGNPVGGSGSYYFLGGAGNNSGKAVDTINFGNVNDEVYFGDWDGDGAHTDTPMVRRGNIFYTSDESGNLVDRFVYGDAGDKVLIGDWNGDGVDSIAIQRGNHYFVKNDNTTSGVADSEFFYGDAGDKVLVGNWDGMAPATEGVDANKDGDYSDANDTMPAAALRGSGDTLMVVRGNTFFVKNDIKSGVADYTFAYGNSGDDILVGDWATAPKYGDDPATVKKETNYYVSAGDSSDGADELAVRRGNVYFQSENLEDAHTAKRNPQAADSFAYGNPTDVAFVASHAYTYDMDTDHDSTTMVPDTITGDGLGVRRADALG